MAGKCEHGLTTRECMVCASPKYGAYGDGLDALVLKMQRDSLRDALVKLLDTHEREAKATMSYQNARENFSDSAAERKAHERAMLAANAAEREARVLLLTLRNGA